MAGALPLIVSSLTVLLGEFALIASSLHLSLGLALIFYGFCTSRALSVYTFLSRRAPRMLAVGLPESPCCLVGLVIRTLS